jgi:nucleoside-diphosphate-sugar epimerase
MKSLVTGGRGFIGSVLVEKLLKECKDEVIVIDNNSSNNKNNFNIKGAKYYNLDLNDFDKILPLFKNIDRVFHLAADVSIDFCNKNPRTSGINNSNITLNTLECCRLNKVKRYIYSSTSAVYKQKKEKLKEMDHFQPLNLYSASKLFGENLCKIYNDLYGVETICLRYFNVFGPSMKKSPYSSVLVNFLNNRSENKPLIVHGNGKQTRDFVFVEDIAKANIIASTLKLKKYGKIYNVGSGKSLSIIDLAKKISNNITFVKHRNGDIKNSCSNIKKLKKDFNWKPKVKIEKWLNQINTTNV